MSHIGFLLASGGLLKSRQKIHNVAMLCAAAGNAAIIAYRDKGQMQRFEDAR